MVSCLKPQFVPVFGTLADSGNSLDVRVKALLRLFNFNFVRLLTLTLLHFVGGYTIERDLKVLKNSSYTLCLYSFV